MPVSEDARRRLFPGRAPLSPGVSRRQSGKVQDLKTGQTAQTCQRALEPPRVKALGGPAPAPPLRTARMDDVSYTVRWAIFRGVL